MKKPDRSKWIYLVLLLLAAAIAAILLYILPGRYQLYHTEFLDQAEVVSVNPLTGFAPPAENQADCAGTRLVTITLTWADWEPEEGEFDEKGLEETFHIQAHQEENRNAVLRFVCDSPGAEEHMDIPRWLYERTGDGAYYDVDYGKGYAPDYTNAEFRRAHREAIQALAEYCNDNSFVAYVEVGSLGVDGTWHTAHEEDPDVPDMPEAEVCADYLRDYDAFRNAALVFLNDAQASEQGKGTYFHALGDAERARDWRRSQQSAFWENGPVGGSLREELKNDTLMEEELQEILQEIRDCHITYISRNCPNAEQQRENNSRMIMSTIGSCIYVSRLQTTVNYRRDTLVLDLTFRNTGVAPFPQDWPATLYLYDREGKQLKTQPLELKLTELGPEEELSVSGEIAYTHGLNQGYSVGISIRDPEGDHFINLAQKGVDPDEEGIYRIYEYNPSSSRQYEVLSQPSSYAKAMVDLIADLSAYAKERNPEFVMVTNGGYGLYLPDDNAVLTEDSRVTLTSSVDAVLVENVFYGWNNQMNRETPKKTSREMQRALNYARSQNLKAMNIEYCNKLGAKKKSGKKSRKAGSVWYNATDRELNELPPLARERENRKNTTELSQVKNFVALLNPDHYKTRAEYLKALRETDFDLIFIDLSFQGEPLTKKEVNSLKKKGNGGKRMVCAYMSVGEAEDYRDYWQTEWSKETPAWICEENEFWEGNYKVMYWMKPWRDILFGSENSYLDQILAAGFDGVYLDVVDAYEYFTELDTG